MSPQEKAVSVERRDDGCGGCVMFVVAVLLLWALWFGLPVNGNVLEIDLFPPAVRYGAPK